MGEVRKGKKVCDQKCAQCHTVERGGEHRLGQSSTVYLGERQGSPWVFSRGCNKNKGTTWSNATLMECLENPKKCVPGTKIVFAVIKKRRKGRT